jgi:hypothetical protein
MTPFEYIIVLISIILGLGITTLLTGVAELIKHNRSTKLFTPYLIWIGLVFVLHIHEWWESYSLKSITTWKLPMFLFVILYPIALYVLAHLLFPSDLKEKAFNSKEFYLSNYPKLFITTLIFVTISFLYNITITGHKVYEQVPHFIIAIVLLTILLTKNKSPIVHTLVSFFFLLLLVISLMLTTESLQIN